MTSNRRLHRLTTFAAVSVLVAITSTVSALGTQHEIASAPAPAAAPVVVVTSTSDVDDATLTHASAARLAHPVVVVRTVRATPTKAVTTKSTTVTSVQYKPKSTVTATRTTRTTSVRKAATPKVAATQVVSARVRTISSYVDAPGSQKAIDACKLVLWTHSPLWLAGHNWCGWQWMSGVPTGSTVRVSSGRAAGTYVVTGHIRLNRQSGKIPQVSADLVLQTCVGSGTGLTLLRRV